MTETESRTTAEKVGGKPLVMRNGVGWGEAYDVEDGGIDGNR